MTGARASSSATRRVNSSPTPTVGRIASGAITSGARRTSGTRSSPPQSCPGPLPRPGCNPSRRAWSCCRRACARPWASRCAPRTSQRWTGRPPSWSACCARCRPSAPIPSMPSAWSASPTWKSTSTARRSPATGWTSGPCSRSWRSPSAARPSPPPWRAASAIPCACAIRASCAPSSTSWSACWWRRPTARKCRWSSWRMWSSRADRSSSAAKTPS